MIAVCEAENRHQSGRKVIEVKMRADDVAIDPVDQFGAKAGLAAVAIARL